MAVYTTDAAFHQQMFGCEGRFPTHRFEGDWLIFQAWNWTQPRMFHGCCLSQLHQILSSNVWRAGLCQPPSSTSPMGIYLATTPSAALDRASLKRGYARSLHPRGIPNGWDCPVVIGMGLNIGECGLHRRLANTAELRRHTIHHNRGLGAPVDLAECQVLDVRIFKPLYDRYQKLPQRWDALKRGARVLRRARRGRPEDFFSGGHGAPLSCGRTTEYPDGVRYNGWLTTGPRGTRQWRCPTCDRNYNQSMSCVTGHI